MSRFSYILGTLSPGLFFFFFSQFCDAATWGDHPQEELTKFGYRAERKVVDIFSSKSGDFGTFFLTKIL
jgi:hypothetical protein